MIPGTTDLVAMLIRMGGFLRELGPFILLGAAAAAAQMTLLGKHRLPWRGHRLIAPIAAVPLGLFPVLASVGRSWLLSRAGSSEPVDASSKSGAFQRVASYLDDLIIPYLLSAIIAAGIIVLTPTEPLWSLLSPPGLWRFLVAPLVAGIIKPRGGAELPLVIAMAAKGLDPAGIVAAIAGAGYLHASSVTGGLIHIVFGVACGVLLLLLGLV